MHRRRFLGSLASSLLASNRRMAVAAASARPSTGKRFTVWTSPPSAGADEAVLFPFDLNSLPFTRDLRMTLETARRKPDEVDGGLNIVMDPRHPGGKGPVLDHGAPGDPDATEVICPNVFRVDGEYRMWYLGADADGRRRTGQYAVSKDGFHWEKPKLGLVEFRGSTRNNLVAGPCGEWMFHDPEDPDPGRRFKSLYMGKEMRISTSYSADGLRWRAGREDIFGLGMEVGHVFRFNGCYFANGQGGPAPINRTIPPAVEGASKRIMITYASYDFERWTHAAALSFRKDSIPPRPPEDFEPHRGEQVHEGAAVWNRGNVLIGLYGQYHNATNDRDGSVIDLGLIVSHDGLHFQEPVPDFKMVTSYEEADGAAPRLLQRNAFANMDDRTVYWYSIWKDRLRPQTGVRVATWVRDRLGYFAAAHANHGFGAAYEPHCVSCPIELGGPGCRVFLNADGLGEHSQLAVELLGLDFTPLPGYSGADCIPVTRPGLRQAVSWRGREALDTLAGPVRVRVDWKGVRPEDARLYAVYLGDERVV